MKARIEGMYNNTEHGEDQFIVNFSITLNKIQMEILIKHMNMAEVDIDKFVGDMKDEGTK